MLPAHCAAIMVEVEEVVVQKSYTEDEICIDVYVALIAKKEAASILQTFCDDIPLQLFGLNHLKRIQPLDRSDKSSPLQIVICPVKLYDDIPAHIKLMCSVKEVRKVCRLEPQCRSEFEAWNRDWPINFHASHLEKEREKGLCAEELKQVQYAYSVLQSEEDKCTSRAHCGVVMNPENGKVVATTSDALQVLASKYHTQNPEGASVEELQSSAVFQALHTATMQCIEGVAAVVRGDIRSEGSDIVYRYKALLIIFYPLLLYVYLTCFSEDVLPENAYLCSGLDLYLTSEPDLMSSMALVHSRIRRVFFKHRDVEAGALISGRGHIHSLRALNHHYRVFQLHPHSSATAGAKAVGAR